MRTVCLTVVVWAWAVVSAYAARYDVKPGDDLQAVINKAVPGDEIVLQPGRYAVTLKIPEKPFGATIVVRSSIIPPSRRMGPADASTMPTLYAPVNDAVLTAEGVNRTNWKFSGIAFEPSTTWPDGEAIVLEGVRSFDFDQVVITGASNGTRRGVRANAADFKLTRSYVGNIFSRDADSQAVCAWNSPGPFLLSDNTLIGSGENVMFGGADSTAIENIPSNILVERNTIIKDDAWKGTNVVVKNLFELKAARQVIVRENLFAGNWAGQGQSGFAIVLTPRNQSGTAPWTVVSNVMFEGNAVLDTDRGINILGYDNLAPTQKTDKVTIRANILKTRDLAILATNEIGLLEIYGNRIDMPEGAVLSLDKTSVWPVGSSAPRPATHAVSSLLWANNEFPAVAYVHSPTVTGTTGVFNTYVTTYFLSGGDMTNLIAALALVAAFEGNAPQTQTTVITNQPVTFAFDWTAPAPPAGLSWGFRFYVDNVAVPAVVFGNPINGVIQFIHPGFPTTGTKSARVGVRWVVTDATKFECVGTTATAVPDVDCTELSSDALAFTVNAPTVPPPPKPSNLRIIVTPITGGGGDILGATIELSVDDALIVKQFVPVAHRRTGAFLSSMNLASPTIIEKQQ